MELQVVRQNHDAPSEKNNIILSEGTLNLIDHHKKNNQNPFIEANTKDVSLSCLKEECVIPVFAKDNEKTIAHQEFIEIAQESVHSVFKDHLIDLPEIRVSHQIKGRVPGAIHKSVSELLEEDKTQYFERMAFIIRIPSIIENINGNDLSLIVGGVRAYNCENLYSKKSIEKFKFFIGFQNMVCCNLCVSTDGYLSNIKVMSILELKEQMNTLLKQFDHRPMLQGLQELQSLHLTEHQFAQLLGKSRLYHHLTKKQKAMLPNMDFNDGQLNAIAKDYYDSEGFCRNEEGDINLWNVYNLFTSAGKSSYIDSFLDRNVNALSFTKGLAQTLNGDSNYHWFLS